MTDYDRTVKRWNRLTEEKWLTALERFFLPFSYHSCKIENEKITFRDTREIFAGDAVTNYTGDLRTLLEIRGANEASYLFFWALGEDRALDESLIKEFQKILTESTYDPPRIWRGETPGEYKRGFYVVGKEETGALPEDVPEEMAELLSELPGVSSKDALTAAAYFHCKFENIHPFADGNGRTGRISMNYLLVQLDHPPIIIHEEDRKAYYEALDTWSRSLDLDPMREFLQSQTVKTWKGSRAPRSASDTDPGHSCPSSR